MVLAFAVNASVYDKYILDISYIKLRFLLMVNIMERVE